MSNPTLEYGLSDNGMMKYIRDVPKGLDCDCKCPACGCKLVARQGDKLAWHFAHHNSDECPYARETALHCLAKQILSEASEIWLPKIPLNPYANFEENLFDEGFYMLQDRPVLETPLYNIVPDVILIVNNEKIIVEVHVTHAVDNLKLEKIIDHSISAIEVDLHPDDINDIDTLRTKLLGKSTCKRWLHNNVAMQKHNMLRQRFENEGWERKEHSHADTYGDGNFKFFLGYEVGVCKLHSSPGYMTTIMKGNEAIDISWALGDTEDVNAPFTNSFDILSKLKVTNILKMQSYIGVLEDLIDGGIIATVGVELGCYENEEPIEEWFDTTIYMFKIGSSGTILYDHFKEDA